jgi:hypothetical protein
MMRKQYLRVLIALIGIAGSGMAAKGQVVDQIVVKIPYEFVVAGQVLPAGTYRVDRASDKSERVLVLSSFENHASIVVFPTQAEVSKSEQSSVSFEQVGGQYFLREIRTADHLFTVRVSRSEIMQAAAKSHSGASATGSVGSN